MNSDKKIIKALLAAAKAHQEHTGKPYEEDDNWANWYAEYLLTQTDFKATTERIWQTKELAEALFDLHKSYALTSRRHSWSRYYAERLKY